jgi:hypothetical protein
VARPGAKVDQLIDDRFDPETLGEGGGQQPGVGDRVVVIEGDGEPVWAVGRVPAFSRYVGLVR